MLKRYSKNKGVSLILALFIVLTVFSGVPKSEASFGESNFTKTAPKVIAVAKKKVTTPVKKIAPAKKVVITPVKKVAVKRVRKTRRS